MFRFLTAIAVGFLPCLLMGCGGDGVAIEDLTGTATFNGQPIKYGELELIPNTETQQEGPAGFAHISDGKFDTKLDGRGVVFGSYKVRVTAYESAPAATEDETAEVEPVKPLFTGYTMDMDIWQSELAVDVPAEAAGFDISKPAASGAGGGSDP